ncbi:hypothetical protein HUG17_1520 [Dermatophagoides farinae]|uniref:Uncharacterized protein n=1 Tax=Dermatophagoides farinae TaxID=6954 RepID=A0A9D4SLB2_DERFA|nr:uncharacterized protein LOC124493035 [Dermatophagoides farinae]KAH7645982.1 hypothetical protein HUG17_1520 [Dermatophagoides farinae]
MKSIIITGVILSIFFASVVYCGPPMRENPEFKRLSQEIQEKVCSGKTTEEQLNKLTKCMEDIKDEMGEREFMEQYIQECLGESEVDVGFTVDEAYKETVYLICSGKFRMCIHQKARNISRNDPDNDDDEKKESKDNGPRGPPHMNPEFHQKVQKMMDCKRKALEL